MSDDAPTQKDGVEALSAYCRTLEAQRAQTTDEDLRYRLGVPWPLASTHATRVAMAAAPMSED